jgi:type II secretory ATPase GspE/PulE/Tfp pilus assembly ATPase PilB-like protein
MGLRLVRSICPNCAQSYEPTPSQLKVVPEALVTQAQFRRGAGCEQCNQSGYDGRLPVSELLVVDEPFREAVLKKLPTSASAKSPSSKACARSGRTALPITGQTTLKKSSVSGRRYDERTA